MNYIEAPVNHIKGINDSLAVFLAGGITDCPDWQSIVVNALREESITLYNPRRKVFPMDKPDEAQRQIKWEHHHLNQADAILFWFPKETLCPITLYELGAHSNRDIPLIVGVHPEYKRRQDVVIQMSIVRPKMPIYSSLSDVIFATKYAAPYLLQMRKNHDDTRTVCIPVSPYKA